MKKPKSGFINPDGPAAFTLFEVIVAMAVLAVMAGGLFASVRAAVQTSEGLREEMVRQRDVAAFDRWCDDFFASVPATSRLRARVRQDPGEDSYFAITVSGISCGLQNHALLNPQHNRIDIAVRKQPNGLTSLCVRELGRRGSGGSATRTDATGWVELLPDLDEVTWKFYDIQSGKWYEDWRNPRTKPGVIELTYHDRIGEQSHRSVFWVASLSSPTKPSPASKESEAATTATDTESSTTEETPATDSTPTSETPTP